MERATDPLPVFVVGVPRSGTTWVQRMLVEHPDAWPLVETYMFSRQIGLGALLRSAGRARDADQLAEAPAGLGRLFSRPELVDEVRVIARRWLRRGSDPDARFVVEKSPWHLRELDVIAEVLPEARYVHVVRDGRDVAVSLIAARRTWSREGPDRAMDVVREAAVLWADGIDRGRVASAQLGDRLLEIRYEEIHADPHAASARLFRHAGMPHDDELVARAVRTTDFERIPEPKGEDRALRAGRVGDWRARFGMSAAIAFERRAGEVLRETGYESDPRWWLRRPVRSRL